jgi:hypothetical protein
MYHQQNQKPSSNKKPDVAFGLHHAKHKAISLDDDTLESFEKPNITIGQFDVETPSTKETRVIGTTIVTSRLVGALGGKIKPTLTTSMVSPLETKCLIWELINYASFIGMVNMKK